MAGATRDGETVDRNEAWAAEAAARGRIDLLSVIPLVAIVALVGLVGALAWIVEGREAARVRAQLATDALWVEQTLRFQLSRDEDMLARLALDEAGGVAPATLDQRARLHIVTNPEVLSLVWQDAGGGPLRAVPRDAVSADVALRALAAAPSSRPVYGDVIRRDDGSAIVALGLRSGTGQGLIVATVSLSLLLERHIPWWIAEQYAVELVDAGGAALVARSRTESRADTPSHTISFDPPLRGILLRIRPHQHSGTGANTLLLAGIAAISAFAVLALGMLYRNTDRRRRAEARLRGEMAFRRSMEESLTVGLRAKDHQGRVLYVNTAFCQLVGWPAADLVGKRPPMPYWSEDHLHETLARQRSLAEGGARSQSFETRFRHRDGRLIDVQVYEAPLIDAQGQHRGWMGSIIDTTEARRAARLARAQEESLGRTARLVTLGEMASTLAHELNQPLAAIASYAAGAQNLLARGQADPAQLGPALEKLSHQAGRAGQIIRRIKDLVNKREPNFSRLSLAEVVTDTVGFLAADARERRLRLATRIEPAPAVDADRILMEQVLINLIRNGMEAMPPGRRSGDVLTVSLRALPGGCEIAVADQGQGVEPAISDTLFDAFASTKTDGMGMGLKICRTIAELHRGHLVFHPNHGGGTVFVLTLPAAANTEAA